MGTFNCFEEIKAWQKAHNTTLEIYRLTNETNLKSDFGLKDQMRRASISIGSNIAEGFERNSNKQFIYFLNVSKASSAELRSQLLLAKDLNYITENEYINSRTQLLELNKMISGLMNYLKKLK